MTSQLLKTLLRKSSEKITTNVLSKMPIALFCEDGKRNGYDGDEIEGFPMKSCNKFFQTPSDVGFCITKNLDVNNLIRAQYLDQYSDFMEIKKQGQGIQALRGTYSSESTDILMTNIFNDDQSLSYLNVSYVLKLVNDRNGQNQFRPKPKFRPS